MFRNDYIKRTKMRCLLGRPGTVSGMYIGACASAWWWEGMGGCGWGASWWRRWKAVEGGGRRIVSSGTSTARARADLGRPSGLGRVSGVALGPVRGAGRPRPGQLRRGRVVPHVRGGRWPPRLFWIEQRGPVPADLGSGPRHRGWVVPHVRGEGRWPPRLFRLEQQRGPVRGAGRPRPGQRRRGGVVPHVRGEGRWPMAIG